MPDILRRRPRSAPIPGTGTNIFFFLVCVCVCCVFVGLCKGVVAFLVIKLLAWFPIRVMSLEQAAQQFPLMADVQKNYLG